MSNPKLKELVELKEELKKETGGEKSSSGRILDILKIVESLCESITREQFVDSKVGATVKKLTEGDQSEEVKAFATNLMNKWRGAFAKRENSLNSVSSPKPVPTDSRQSDTSKLSAPQEPKRQKTCTFLEEAFSQDIASRDPIVITNLCIEIEEALFNLGQDQYNTKCRSLRLNLPKNNALREQLLDGKISAETLVRLTAEDLLSPHIKEKIDKEVKSIIEEKRSDWYDANRETINKAAGIKTVEGLFKCRRCGSSKTTYYQKQTRSAEYVLINFFNG